MVPEVMLARAGDVLTIGLNRPAKRNALTRSMLGELLTGLHGAAQDRSLRLVILRAEGSVFCAGMDLAEMQSTAADPQAAQVWQADARVYAQVVSALWSLPVPTLAVVQGPAVAGGVGLCAACDLVLASESASFSLPEPRRGIVAAVVTPVLRRRVGPAAAGHLLLSLDVWDAATALRRGLCDELASPTGLAEATQRLTRSILGGSPGALRLTKQLLRAGDTERVASELEAAVTASGSVRESAEAAEGLRAFLEKRPAVWAVE